MSFILSYMERLVSYLFYNTRNNEDLMLTKSPAFASFPKPTITVTSPDGGPDNTVLKLEHTQDGEDWHPTLKWVLPDGLTGDVDPAAGKIKVWEYVVSCEDLDLPLPQWISKVSRRLNRYGVSKTRNCEHLERMKAKACL